MSAYRFVSRFVVTSPPAEVFRAVMEPEAWLSGLRHVRRLEHLADGDRDGIGSIYATEVTAVPYRLRWQMEAVEVVPDVLLAWAATGDLAGRGTWTLSALPPGTLVTSRWDVRTTPPWMRLLRPLAAPLFVSNHDRVMRAGAELLADHLGAELTSFSCSVTRGQAVGADYPPERGR